MDVDAQVFLSSSLERESAFMNEENGKKARKPYTITKQRERWSEEEHLRFIEALRLHGRAWRKIEEHIGTKTAVQIRSHAQKFFNKLEKKKEAGEVDKEEEFTIPPPRPKRKPAKPYPRKDGVTSSGYTGTSQLQLSPRLQAAAQQQLNGGLAPTSSGQHLPGFGLLNGLTHSSSNEVTDATVAAVTAAASAAAAAAAAAVVAAAGQEVQTHMQVHPPSCFPFFGMPPSALAQITPNGVSALDQAALLAQQAAAVKAAAMRGFGGVLAAVAAAADGVAPAAPDASNSPAGDTGVLGDPIGSDRGLVEATGTTDGTHISANAQLRGSDGDSACSRETDNQDGCPSLTMDVSWQSKLHQHQAMQQQQHENGSSSPSAAAARSLAGLQAGGFDPSQLQWGSGRCGSAAAGGFDGMQGAAAAAVLHNLPGLSPAQALALLSNPLYLAAADRQYQHAALQAAAAAAAGLVGAVDAVPTGARSSGRAASSGGGAAAGVASGRTKSRRTAPSVNSGSTGPPVGTKRMLEGGSEQCMLPAKKAARELSDTGEEGDGEGMEASPSSPSIQEKELKAASQPSNTNGNTSGSNESDASKRRQGTGQGEGSNPTNGNSSGNGYSVKDSNTGTNTGTNGHTNGNGNGYSCGNGTSAFNPVGHRHHHHSHQQPNRQANNYSSNQQQGGGSSAAANRHGQHHYGGHAAQNAAGEGSNGGNGASGTGLSTRDEGRSSSDLEGPSQLLQLQQQQLQLQQEQDDEVMDEPMGEGDADGEQEEEQQQQHHQQQHSEQAAQLHAIMASLHGLCGKHPLMLQQAYGAAAAAAATAQQIVANAMHTQQPSLQLDLQGAAANPLAALQQQLRQQGSNIVAPPVSQGFTPWQNSTAAAAAGTSEFGSSGSFIGNSLLWHGHAGTSAAQQLQMQAAAGLVGLASSWGTSGAASSGGNGGAGLYGSYGQQQQQHYHYHSHNHNHTHQQQGPQHKAAQHTSGGGMGSSEAAAAAAAAGLQQLQQGLGLGACSGNRGGGASAHPADLHAWGGTGMSGCSGLEALTRAASAGALAGSDDGAGK